MTAMLRLQVSEKQIQDHIANNLRSPEFDGVGTALYIIPVEIHVVHTCDEIGTLYNPSDAQITPAIDYLNQLYDDTAAGFSGGAGDFQIQFKLDERDGDSNPTMGIDRVDGCILAGYATYGVKRQTANGVTDVSLKNQSRWNPGFYNI